jgi:tripartite-type tricarboxylate transporter receptor subunit TctC
MAVRFVSTLLLLALWVAGSRAETIESFYRGKTIRLLIGGSAGGGYDAVGRLVARHMGRHIPGNPVLSPENMDGAGSLIMMNYVQTKTNHDGTIIALPTTNVLLESKLRLMAAASGNVSFDVDKLMWIGTPAQEPQVLFVWHDTPFYTLDDLKKNRLVVGAVSASTDTYILPMFMKEILGTNTVAIPGYKGSAEILAAMERREVDAHVALLANITAGNASYLKTQKIRVILQFGSKRSSDMPAVPTAAEYAATDEDRELFGFYGIKYQMSYPLVAPGDTPRERVEALRDAFNATMLDPLYQDEARRIGISLTPMSGLAMQDVLRKVQDIPDERLIRIRDIILRASKR